MKRLVVLIRSLAIRTGKRDPTNGRHCGAADIRVLTFAARLTPRQEPREGERFDVACLSATVPLETRLIVFLKSPVNFACP
jgi:hypothetical protein